VTLTSRMDALLWGRSALPCYEPLFGYGLEMFPARQLRSGPITDRIAGDLINLTDPRCYLTQSDKSCVSGSLFRSEEKSDAMVFASHRPLRWQKPLWQILAELATLGGLAVSALILSASVAFGVVPVSKFLFETWRKGCKDGRFIRGRTSTVP
jgi:hypothetical protein